MNEKQEDRVLPVQSQLVSCGLGQLKFFTVVYMSVNDHESATSVGLGVTNKF